MHVHSIFLWPTWAAASASRRCRVPYVVTPHGMLVKDLVYRKSRWVKRAWIRWIEKRNIEEAAALHVTSQIEANEAKAFGFRLPPIAMVPYGVDASGSKGGGTPSADLLQVLENPNIVLFLGRINWKKGLDRLIPALSRVPRATLVLAGNDEENYRPVLERLALRSGVGERIRFVGSVYGADKAALLSKAKLLVLHGASHDASAKQTFEVSPGDLLYWPPQYWHMGENSRDIAISINVDYMDGLGPKSKQLGAGCTHSEAGGEGS